jgi:hypothetical protein
MCKKDNRVSTYTVDLKQIDLPTFNTMFEDMAAFRTKHPKRQAAQRAPLRVIALGGSITYGYNDPKGNSYCRYLAYLLWISDNSISTIGSVKNGNWDNNESGSFIYHTVDDILHTGTPELTRDTEKPNIATLHAGTINFVPGKTVTDAPERLRNLVGFTTNNNPSTLLVVSRLTPNTKTNVSA